MGLVLLCLLVVLLWTGAAAARPQANVGLRPGVCGAGTSGLWQETCFYGAVHGDVMFGRERNRDIGYGPYLDLGTEDFADARLGGGLSLQLPVAPLLPIVASTGGYYRWGSGQGQPGISGRVFLGSRSFNFHSPYVLAVGLVVGADVDLSGEKRHALIAAVHVDAAVLLLLPALLLRGAIAGGSD